MPYQSTTQGAGGTTATNPFENAAGAVFNGNNINTPIVTGTAPAVPFLQQNPLLPGTSVQTTGTQASLSEKLAQMSKGDLQALQQKLISTGLFPSVRVTGVADGATLAAYNTVLGYSLLYQYANPEQKAQYTPDNIIGMLQQAKPKDTTQSTTTVNLTNRVQAEQSLITAFSDKLGRRPTDAEVSAFTSALNSYESQNPDVVTADVAGDGSGTVKSQTNTDKGTGTLNFVNDFASQYAINDPSVQAEYQAGQHLDFYNLALQALSNGPVSTGNST